MNYSNLCIPLFTDADVRYWVVASLDESFDQHLAQAENLSALFVAMNDEVFEIRELAVCTIGRLSCLNPAYVMPSLRKTLIQVQIHRVFYMVIISYNVLCLFYTTRFCHISNQIYFIFPLKLHPD